MIDTKMFNWTNNKYQKLNNEIYCKLNNLNHEKKPLLTEKNNIKIIKNVNSNKVIEAKTLSSPWFCPNMKRKQAESVLKSSPVGSFIVRNSSSQNSSYVLSLRVGGVQVHHHLLILSRQGQDVQLSGSKKVFPSIFSLVTHLSIMKENLACRLVIHDKVSEESDVSDNEDIVDIDSEPEMEEVVMQLKKFLSVK